MGEGSSRRLGLGRRLLGRRARDLKCSIIQGGQCVTFLLLCELSGGPGAHNLDRLQRPETKLSFFNWIIQYLSFNVFILFPHLSVIFLRPF